MGSLDEAMGLKPKVTTLVRRHMYYAEPFCSVTGTNLTSFKTRPKKPFIKYIVLLLSTFTKIF